MLFYPICVFQDIDGRIREGWSMLEFPGVLLQMLLPYSWFEMDSFFVGTRYLSEYLELANT